MKFSTKALTLVAVMSAFTTGSVLAHNGVDHSKQMPKMEMSKDMKDMKMSKDMMDMKKMEMEKVHDWFSFLKSQQNAKVTHDMLMQLASMSDAQLAEKSKEGLMAAAEAAKMYKEKAMEMYNMYMNMKGEGADMKMMDAKMKVDMYSALYMRLSTAASMKK